jgi:hypothetical protein
MRCGVDGVLRKAMPFAHWRMSASLRTTYELDAAAFFEKGQKRTYGR